MTESETIKYIEPTVCATPILPSGNNISLPDDLRIANSIIHDPSKDLKARISSQNLIERYLVEKGRCSKLNPLITEDYELLFFTINGETLNQTLLGEQSLNASLHSDITCAIDSIIYNNNTQINSFSPLQREKIRNWFPNISQIGPESVEGYALKTSFPKSTADLSKSIDTDLFIIKVPRNPKNDELVHEAVIGMYALNALRRILPHYMYIYGYTRCSPPIIENKEVITWCSTSTPSVSYLITENIKNSESIGDFIINPQTTPFDFIAVFYELINALNLGYKTYNYTHYDLHYRNVLVRKYSRIIAIPYLGTTNKTIGYIATLYVPYIIDYGYSYISLKLKNSTINLGKLGLEHAGIDSNRPFPMYDIYKIICFLGESIYTGKRTKYYNEMVVVLETLFSFFDDGTLYDRVVRRLSFGNDWYNAEEKYRNITHDQYILWLENNSRLINPIHKDLNILASKGVYTAPINTNFDTCKFYDLFGSNQGPKNSLEYCEVIDAINNDTVLSPEAKDKATSWLNNHFNAELYFTETLPIMNDKIQQMYTIKQNNNIPDIANISDIGSIAFNQFTKSYQEAILNLLRIKDIIASIISYIKASICSLVSQRKYQNNINAIDTLNISVSEWVKFLNNERNLLKRNLSYAKTINWSQITNDKSVIKFWTIDHDNLILAV